MILLRCYPKITDWIFDLFGQAPSADYRFLPIYSYGFFVATGFFFAASLAVAEMRRREKLGLLAGVETSVVVGEAPTMVEVAVNFLIGFVVLFKILGIIAYQPELSKGIYLLKDYMLSVKGSWLGGIIGGALLSYYFYYSKNKEKLPQPVTKKQMVYPSDSVGDLVVIAAVLGVLGSNLFNFLENPGDYQNFWSDPLGSLFSGLSIYGGLICAGIGFGLYARKKKFHLGHFFDSVAPGFILANGIGRIGCQVAGDGDWGIANFNPKPDWIPQFLWSSHYEHNIIDADAVNIIPGCYEEHCRFLTHAVYPTPLYEFLMCTAIFIILWSIRKKLTYKPGTVFTVFMILIGIQRYAIEQWRDLSGRDLYHVFGFALRQSELISIILFLAGVISTAFLFNLYSKKKGVV
jgi:prolipoprotein diacylglyceryltransferase